MALSWIRKKPKKRRASQVGQIFAQLAAVSSTMLVRAQYMVRSLWSQPEDSGSKSPDVYGCRNCGIIYDPHIYFWGSEVTPNNLTHCPKCSAPQVKLLGALPYTFENNQGVHFVNDDDETMGPFKNEADARNWLWEWFNRKERHAKDKEGTCEEGKIIWLHSKGPTKEGKR